MGPFGSLYPHSDPRIVRSHMILRREQAAGNDTDQGCGYEEWLFKKASFYWVLSESRPILLYGMHLDRTVLRTVHARYALGHTFDAKADELGFLVQDPFDHVARS